MLRAFHFFSTGLGGDPDSVDLGSKNEIVTVDTIPPSTVCCVGEAPGTAARMLFKQYVDVMWSDEDW